MTASLKSLESLVLKAARDSVEAGLQEFEQSLREEIPARRKKTQRAIQTVMDEQSPSGIAGVIFPPGSRYPANGTETEKLVERVWIRNADQVAEAIQNKMVEVFSSAATSTIVIQG